MRDPVVQTVFRRGRPTTSHQVALQTALQGEASRSELTPFATLMASGVPDLDGMMASSPKAHR